MEIWKKFTNLSNIQKEIDNFSLFFFFNETNKQEQNKTLN